MATPADLLAAAGAAGAARRPIAPRPVTGTPSSTPGAVSLEASPTSAPIRPQLMSSQPAGAGGGAPAAPTPTLSAPPPGGFPGFRPMGSGIGGGAGMMVPPAPPPAMAQGHAVTEQDGEPGIMGDHGGFQRLGPAALRHAGGGGMDGGVSSSYGGSGGIINQEELHNRGGGMGGFHPASPIDVATSGGGMTLPTGFHPPTPYGGDLINKPQVRSFTPNVADAPSDAPAGMSSIGQAVGRTMFGGRRPRSMVSRDGAATGY